MVEIYTIYKITIAILFILVIILVSQKNDNDNETSSSNGIESIKLLSPDLDNYNLRGFGSDLAMIYRKKFGWINPTPPQKADNSGPNEWMGVRGLSNEASLIKESNVNNLKECNTLCDNDANCTSFNYNYKDGICQLLNSNSKHQTTNLRNEVYYVKK